VSIPEHIAIIMDGNGRWAKKRLLPRVAGHARGVKRVREIVEHCSEIGVKYLTLFAFGRENWKRPVAEVSFLMNLLLEHLDKEFLRLHEENVKIRFIGDRSRLDKIICEKIDFIEKLTLKNKGLNLNMAVDYSGSYDIIQAVNTIITEGKHKSITRQELEKYLLTYPSPAPDLFIRTSGEIRISNFMLWQMAYTELYFTSKLWPDFNKKALDDAIHWFQTRERRYGKISEQLE
jgi:undecaprenyl diphosphate synthase